MAKTPAKPASTQNHLHIAQIRDDLVITKDGAFRAVLLVSSINFALKSQQEQDAIIYQFQNFINSLTSSIQIVVQSRQLDLNSYLQHLEDLATSQTNELMRFQMVDYIDYVSRLITLANIMDKRFFVVIPLDTAQTRSRGLFSLFMGGRKTAPHFSQQQFDRYKEQMEEHISVIISGLGGMGLRAVQLNTQELVEFYYGIYNPEEAVTEKLVDPDQLRKSIIEKGQGENNG